MGLRDEYERRCREPSDIYEHLPALFEAVMQAPENPLVVEFGTRTGNSTAAFLYGLQVRQGGGRMISVDPDIPDVPDEWFDDSRWRYVTGRSTDEDVRDYLYAFTLFDVLFVDTDHTYDTTLRELEWYMPRVRPGGVALFHDTMVMNDVCDVAKALTTYCAANGLVWTEARHCYGLGRIEVPR